MNKPLSALYWTFCLLSSAALFPIAILIWAVTAPLDPRRRLLHRFTCFWASLYTRCNPSWPVTIEGREKIRSDETYVMVANHQSLLDIMLLFRLATHFKWVSKTEVFRIPIIGWNMALNQYIQLKRGDKRSVIQMLRECRRTLKSGSSIMIFPEGTRSHDGQLLNFKSGAFSLARQCKRPILPIVVNGTAATLPKRGLVLRGRHPLQIKVLDEIPYESFSDSSVEDLTNRVQRLIANQLGQLDENDEKEPVPAIGPPEPIHTQ